MEHLIFESRHWLDAHWRRTLERAKHEKPDFFNRDPNNLRVNLSWPPAAAAWHRVKYVVEEDPPTLERRCCRLGPERAQELDGSQWLDEPAFFHHEVSGSGAGRCCVNQPARSQRCICVGHLFFVMLQARISRRGLSNRLSTFLPCEKK